MAQWVDIPIATQAGEGLSPFISDAELVNLMLVPNPPGSPRPFHIANTPGLVDPSISGTGTIRGAFVHGFNLWYVRDSGGCNLYSSLNGAAGVLIGAVDNTGAYRFTGAGANEIVLTNGVATYHATTTTLTTITPPAGTFSDVAYMDGQVIATRSGTDEWYISGIDTPTVFAALDFSTADAMADVLIGCQVDHRDVTLYGRKHIEFWYDAGNADFPFARSSPGVIERGCYAAGTIAKYGNAQYFLGDDLRVYRIHGYALEPISTEWVERLIGAVTVTSASRGSCYVIGGKAYYSLVAGNVFGVSGATLVYCITTGLWHRENRDALGGAWAVDICNYDLSGSTRRVYAAIQNGFGYGRIYRLDEATYRDADGSGVDTTRTMTCPAINADGSRIFEPECELVMEKVDGGTPGAVALAYSDDGGSSYTTHGTQSTNQERVCWQRVGSFKKSRNHRFTILANNRIAISHARARLERGAA